MLLSPSLRAGHARVQQAWLDRQRSVSGPAMDLTKGQMAGWSQVGDLTIGLQATVEAIELGDVETAPVMHKDDVQVKVCSCGAAG